MSHYQSQFIVHFTMSLQDVIDSAGSKCPIYYIYCHILYLLTNLIKTSVRNKYLPFYDL